MTYILQKEKTDQKLNYYNVVIEGLDVTPSGYKADKIKATNIKITDPELTNNFIKRRINNEIEKLIKLILKILNDPDTSSSDVGIVLDEISRLKGIIYNKYKEHMIKSEYKALLSKIMLMEEQFQKNYRQKQFIDRLRESIMDKDMEEYRSRGR